METNTVTRAEPTPGPWTISARLDEGFRVHTLDGGMVEAVADLNEWHTPETTEANARLIAAAPDMLDALAFIPRIAPQLRGDEHDAGMVTLTVTAGWLRRVAALLEPFDA